MHLLNKSQPFIFLILSEYPFLIALRCFLLFLPFSDASLTQNLSRITTFTCVTHLDKPK